MHASVKKLTLKGPNGLTTEWRYDGFGRNTREIRADGTISSLYYYDRITIPNWYWSSLVIKTSSGKTPQYFYNDAYGRTIYNYSTMGLNGQWIIKVKYYNAKWQMYLGTDNYKPGLPIPWTRYAYDGLGRATSVTAPNGDVSSMGYNGLTTTSTNANDQTTTTTKNSQGKVIKVTDANNMSITYGYDAFGNLIKTTDAAGNITTMGYDIRGRKTGMTDPDMGAWTYAYDALGNLISQTDAKGQTTTMIYDQLGRMRSRSEAEGTSTWTYDTLWIGALSSETSGISSKSYLYDTYGRVKSSSTTINSQVFNVGTSYDNIGRVSRITYPTGVVIQRNYNAYNHMISISNVSTGKVLWSANTMDKFGNLTSESFGNGVTTTRTYDPNRGILTGLQSTSNGATIQDWAYDYDAVGNMNFRTDKVLGYTENFTYDKLNRLKTVHNALAYWRRVTHTMLLAISPSNPMWVHTNTPT